jgi:hypothetical protein
MPEAGGLTDPVRKPGEVLCQLRALDVRLLGVAAVYQAQAARALGELVALNSEGRELGRRSGLASPMQRAVALGDDCGLLRGAGTAAGGRMAAGGVRIPGAVGRPTGAGLSRSPEMPAGRTQPAGR